MSRCRSAQRRTTNERADLITEAVSPFCAHTSHEMKLSLEGADKHKSPRDASFRHHLLVQQSGCLNDSPGRYLRN